MPEPTVLLLSTSDTDLISARSSGKNYRWANPSRLSDLELTDLLAEASIVVIRILGGYRAWQSGIDTVIAWPTAASTTCASCTPSCATPC